MLTTTIVKGEIQHREGRNVNCGLNRPDRRYTVLYNFCNHSRAPLYKRPKVVKLCFYSTTFDWGQADTLSHIFWNHKLKRKRTIQLQEKAVLIHHKTNDKKKKTNVVQQCYNIKTWIFHLQFLVLSWFRSIFTWLIMTTSIAPPLFVSRSDASILKCMKSVGKQRWFHRPFLGCLLTVMFVWHLSGMTEGLVNVWAANRAPFINRHPSSSKTPAGASLVPVTANKSGNKLTD